MSSLGDLARAAASCTRCDLYQRATATVFGEGHQDADVMLVGEEPGDVEDKQGRPFVGPAGRMLDRALADSDISRQRAYLTNAVKHFKWTEHGKRRLHQPPNRTEIVACRHWLDEEIVTVRPVVVVALGATAGSALLGPGFRVGAHRGKPEPLEVGGWHGTLLATIHPSAVLRADPEARAQAYDGLVADLRVAASVAGPAR
jgi:uracil-DNA glycosylase